MSSNTCPSCGEPVPPWAGACASCHTPMQRQTPDSRSGCAGPSAAFFVGVLLSLVWLPYFFGGYSTRTPVALTMVIVLGLSRLLIREAWHSGPAAVEALISLILALLLTEPLLLGLPSPLFTADFNEIQLAAWVIPLTAAATLEVESLHWNRAGGKWPPGVIAGLAAWAGAAAIPLILASIAFFLVGAISFQVLFSLFLPGAPVAAVAGVVGGLLRTGPAAILSRRSGA